MHREVQAPSSLAGWMSARQGVTTPGGGKRGAGTVRTRAAARQPSQRARGAAHLPRKVWRVPSRRGNHELGVSIDDVPGGARMA